MHLTQVVRKGTLRMKRNRLANGPAIAIYVVLLVVALILVWRLEMISQEEKDKIGFITSGSVENGGWSTITYQGLKAACEESGMDLLIRTEVESGTGACLEAVQELADEGVRMIILGSYDYSAEMKDVLPDFPKVVFYCSNADYEADNLVIYSERMYQARYLSGVVAGMETKTGKLGFVAAEQSVEVCRAVNAFALGVREVNPDAEILVKWTGAWDNADRAKDAVDALAQEGVDVVSYHQDHLSVVEEAEAIGIMSIGSYEEAKDVSERYLTCAACDWETLYTMLIKEFERGTKSSQMGSWLGLESDTVYLTGFSSLVGQDARKAVEEAKQEVLSGQDVFTGEIYDNEGNQRCAEGEAMSDNTLQKKMDWLVEGVRVYGG